jgi:hypothetical protein
VRWSTNVGATCIAATGPCRRSGCRTPSRSRASTASWSRGCRERGGRIEIHARVAALLAWLGETGGTAAGPSFRRRNDTLRAQLGDPGIRVLLVDTGTDIGATPTAGLPAAAYDALAALRLRTIDKFGIVADDPARLP